MNTMSRIAVVVLVLLTVWCASPAAAQTDIEVVTTIPVETMLKPLGTSSAPAVWAAMVKRAKKRIDWACFYFSNEANQPLEPVINAVCDAADRGVNVRFLVSKPVNKSMAERNTEVIQRFQQHKNITVVEFDWKSMTGGILHAKYFIVDRQEVYVGSQNFDWRSLKHIYETGLRIKDKTMALRLEQIFEADWQFNTGDKEAYNKLKSLKPVTAGKETYIVASPGDYIPPGIEDSLKKLLSLIDNAKKKITVQLLDYHIDVYGSSEKFTAIDNALRKAAARGVDVKLLVSDWNKRKPGVDALKDLVKVPGIQVRFATIPRFSEGFIPYARVIHAKVMRVDDTISWVGTSNWGKRYFFGSRNIEVVSIKSELAKTLDSLFDQLWNSKYCYPLDPATEYSIPRIGK